MLHDQSYQPHRLGVIECLADVDIDTDIAAGEPHGSHAHAQHPRNSHSS